MEQIYINEEIIGKAIRNSFRRFLNKTDLTDGIHEVTSGEDFGKYKNNIWRILQRSYKPLGGFKSYTSANEMAGRISMAILCVKKGRIVACAIYRDDLGGQKLNGCGTVDGSLQSKELLRGVIKDDIENLQKYHWVEVSPPLERWFKEEGGNPIPSKMAPNLLHKSKSKITEVGDGIHYTRQIGKDGDIATKAIYGFNSDSTYNKVMSKLEEYTGFKYYKDFKEYANSLPETTEDIEYSSNHPNKEVAMAMEVVIQIGNLWDDGYRELSRKMKTSLADAIKILKKSSTPSGQIKSLIRNGEYYYRNMEVLECHNANASDFILYPIYH